MGKIIHVDGNMKRVDKSARGTRPVVPPFSFPAGLERFSKDKRWTTWSWQLRDDKWTKPPMRALTGKEAKVNDPDTWDTFEACRIANGTDPSERGVGLMLFGLADLGVIDLDNVVDDNGDLISWAQDIVERCNSYTEWSPSGNGVKIFGIVRGSGEVSKKIKRGDSDIELFSNCRRYVCVTSRVAGGHEYLSDITDMFTEHISKRRESVIPAEVLGPDRVEGLRSALGALDPDDYATWIKMGLALKTVAEDGKALWDEWSARSRKFSQKRNDMEWSAFEPRDIRFETVFYDAMEAGWENKVTHVPLASPIEFIDIGPTDELAPVEFIIDGQIATGSLMFAGMRGAGKTTFLAALANIIVWGCGDLHPMRPRVRRRVIWVSEDTAQIKRIFYAMRAEGDIVIPDDELRGMVYLANARRSDPKALAKVLGEMPDMTYLNQFPGGMYNAAPLVILDTVAATIDLGDENSNADVSRAIATVRQALPGSSIFFVGHVAKAQNRGEAADLTARGASAFESDVQGSAVLAIEEGVADKRFFVLGKKRFTADKNEITATMFHHVVRTRAVWGEREERIAFVRLEATDTEAREVVRDEAAERKQEERENATERRWMTSIMIQATRVAASGKEGLLVGTTAGAHGLAAGFENFESISLERLRTEVCGSRSNKQRATFREFIERCFEAVSESEVRVWRVVRPAQYDIPGLT